MSTPVLQPLTIRGPVSFETEVRRSRFLAFLFPASSREQAQRLVENIRSDHADAVHHCFAWRLGTLGMEYRMSDDGEPSGSAGKPMLFALQQAKLTNVVAVVARYFGGVKLGVGPLARAYAESTRAAIGQAQLIPVIEMATLLVHCLYEDVTKIITLLEEVEATFQPTYSDSVLFEANVPTLRLEYLKNEILTRTNARAGFSKIAAE